MCVSWNGYSVSLQQAETKILIHHFGNHGAGMKIIFGFFEFHILYVYVGM